VLKTVESWQFRLSPWLKMNDPREKKEWRTADIIAGQLQAVPPYTQRELERAFDRLLRRGARLACFTDDRAPAMEHSARWLLHRGWGRSAMWDRYADSHKGGCPVFNSPTLMEQFDTFHLDRLREKVGSHPGAPELLRCTWHAGVPFLAYP
jgi:hypothetical protein